MRIDLHRTLKASALAYAVLISLLLSLITLSLILAMQLHNKRIASITDMHQVARNADSGIELMVADPKLGMGNEATKDLFGTGRDSVYLHRRPWGAYEVLTVRSHRGRQAVRKHVLAGSIWQDSTFTMILADNGKPLSLCGRTRITGNCAIPKAGVKRAYIEGKNYVGSELIYGTQTQSPQTLPPVKYPSFEELLGQAHETAFFDDVPLGTLERSFTEPSLLIESIDAIDLSSVAWSGNLLIRSETAIHITASSSLSRCILSAPKITVDRGFEGDVQLYGDSILIDTEAKLTYPSAIFSKDGHVEIADGSVVVGSIVMERGKGTPTVSIGNEARVYGTVYNQGMTQLKGAVFGQLLTDGFLLRTASATYENHLLDAIVSLEQLPKPFACPINMGGRSIRITDLP